jgi:RpiB/LacA/LacB family sugar-phosphate isomerase
MRIAKGSDHAGFALKEAVKAFLTAEHREVLDLGTHSTDPVDYCDYAEAVGRLLRENRAERGILAVRERVGASMAGRRLREGESGRHRRRARRDRRGGPAFSRA